MSNVLPTQTAAGCASLNWCPREEQSVPTSRRPSAGGFGENGESLHHVNSAQDTALLNVRLFLDALTPAGDFVTFQPGTQTDTEDQIAGRPYGIGTLHLAVDSGALQIQVACEHNAEYASLQPFRVGDLVRVADRQALAVPATRSG